jgi:23S rRNA (adenine2503-C2)-methyltransferase
MQQLKLSISLKQVFVQELDKSFKTNLFGLSANKLDIFFENLGEKKFRTQQVMQWLYQKNIFDFEKMLNLSQSLRDKLKSIACLDLPKVATIHRSKDGTIKWVLDLDNSNAIEMVFIPEKERGTLCISSQVGCALACTFCSTAQQGFNRNLTTAEIMAQVLIAKREVNSKNKRLSNVVFMGMGEPLLNEEAVFDATDLLLDDRAYGLSRRRVTLSTSGVVPAIKRFADTSPVSLAISLHSASNTLRDELMPINKKYPIEKLMDVCHYYLKQGDQKRHILFEYVMLAGVNDSNEDCDKLIKLLKNISAKVNLIPFNPFPNTTYVSSSGNVIKKFQDKLHNAGIKTMTRRTRGDDIVAACGQLAGEVIDKTKRNL